MLKKRKQSLAGVYLHQTVDFAQSKLITQILLLKAQASHARSLSIFRGTILLPAMSPCPEFCNTLPNKKNACHLFSIHYVLALY